MYRWNDNLRIGNAEIDLQHKKLFDIAAKIDDLMEDCKSHPSGKADAIRQQRVLRETIKYLKSYAMKHFAAEEALLLKIEYAGYEKHKNIHDEFAKTVERMEKAFEEEYSEAEVEKFLEWFSSWLYDHVMTADQKIAEPQP